jgi:hypothetical protein
MKKIITSFIYKGSLLTYYLEIDQACETFIFTPCRSNKELPEFTLKVQNNKFSTVSGIPKEIYEQAVAEVQSLITHRIPEQIQQLIHDSFCN